MDHHRTGDQRAFRQGRLAHAYLLVGLLTSINVIGDNLTGERRVQLIFP